MARAKNIKTFTVGATPYTTIKEVEVNESVEEITDSGDNDTVDTFIAKGKASCRGSVTLSDGIQATAMKATAAAAAITFIGEDAANANAMTCTITGALFFNKSTRAMHNGVWQHTVTFRAASYVMA